jgi:hypothetical protein
MTGDVSRGQERRGRNITGDVSRGQRRRRITPVPAPVTNRALRWARADLAAATGELREHAKFCIACMRAARTRRPADHCAEGAALAAAVAEASAAVEHERRIAAEPLPGQGELFSAGEVRAAAGPGPVLDHLDLVDPDDEVVDW